MDLQNRIEIGVLLAEYGSLLTDKQREMLHLYADMDMSLFEVAAEYGVTRQAVHDSIIHACESLEKYEAAIGKVKLKADVRSALDAISKDNKNIKVALSDVYKILED